MKSVKKILGIILAFVCCFGILGCGNSANGEGKPQKYVMSQAATVNALSATDAYGRSFSPVKSMNSSKKVGIFYFVWMGNHGSAYIDNSKTDLDVLKSSSDMNVHHYWGEPLYGYYHSEDPWVIYKHIELFIMAGIDYICLDTTNGVYFSASQDYRKAIDTVLDVLLKFRTRGFNVPQVMFYTNTKSGENVQFLYDNYYNTEKKPRVAKYEPLWFKFEDTNNKNSDCKPWIVANDEYLDLPEEVQNRFYRKESQWPNEYTSGGDFINHDEGFPWMSWAKNGRQYNHNGIMSVSIAQHVSGVFSHSIMLGDKDVNRGRGFSLLHGGNGDDRVDKGSNFQEQWDYAIAQGDKVNNIFITGWNEWVAQKQPANSASQGMSYFVDCFNKEFSRDAEMMRGEYSDAFYLQMCDNIRRFKGTGAATGANPWKGTIDINGDLTQWDYALGYLDATGDAQARDYKSANYSLPNYTQEAGRNDIEYVRFTYDDDNLYFLIGCKENIKPYEGKNNWMNVLLSVDGHSGEAWHNYNYVINRTVNDDTASVEKLKPDGSGTASGEAKIKINGKTLAVAVPRSAVGIGGKTFKLGFKVADSVKDVADIEEYYISGDCAPIGRLNYTVEVK